MPITGYLQGEAGGDRNEGVADGGGGGEGGEQGGEDLESETNWLPGKSSVG